MNNNQTKKTKDSFIKLSTLYIVSNILILFVHGIFWDDWTLYHDTTAIEQQFFNGNGGIIAGYMHLFLQQLPCNTIFLYHSIIFLIGWINVWLFYKILNSAIKLDNKSSFCIAVIYATFPIGYAHMTMICLPYQLGLLLQLIAVLLFTLYIKKIDVVKYLLFFILQFSASLFLVSNVVFWGGLLFFFTLQATWKYRNISIEYGKTILKQLFKWSIYYIPCITFWIVRSIYFTPTGIYEASGYNSFSLKALFMLPMNLFKSITNSLDFLISQISIVNESYTLVFIGLSLFVFIIYILNKNFNYKNIASITKYNFVAIFFLYISAIGAYLMVGHVPIFDTISDRHAILIILTICPFIYYLLNILIVEKVRIYVLAFLLAIMSTYSNSQYLEAIYQSQRNDAIMSFFKKTELPDGNIFVFENEINQKTASCFYSWSGLYYNATGKQDKCFVTSNNYVIYDTENFLTESYHQKNALAGNPIILLEIMNEIETRSYKSIIKRALYYYFQKSKYNDGIKKDFDIRYKEIEKINQIEVPRVSL